MFSQIPDYILDARKTGEWNIFKQWEVKEERRLYKNQINEDYNQLFENAKTFQDSFEIYDKFNLPVEFKEPTFEQKENAVKQNKLENSLDK